MSINRPSDDASQEEWQRYVLERVAPLVAERDARFAEQLASHGYSGVPVAGAAAALAGNALMQAAFEHSVRDLLALAQAAAATGEGLLDALRVAFAPEWLPWPLWLARPKPAGEAAEGAYFASPAWQAECERTYLRELEYRRLTAQGLDFDTVEREKNRPKSDARAIIAQAGLGILGGGVFVVAAEPEGPEEQ